MATNTNTLKTRIQLKSDTEANWNKAGPKDGSNGFVPLSGELIVYTADATHPFCRLKIGDGVTNVIALPFIDSGTINGEEVEIVKKNTFNEFPSPGSSDKLYIELSTNKIYHYSDLSGYIQLSNFTYNVEKTTHKNVASWGAGKMTIASISNNVLIIDNGVAPQLLTQNTSVVTDITRE